MSDEKIRGKASWTTIYALLRAFQIELGITNTADSFGPTTVKRFKERYPNGIRPAGDEETDNVYGIIQGALWCKGYATHYQRLDTHFDEVVEIAIENLKIDAGLKKVDGVVTLNVMKALLSMDYFVIGAGTDGDTKIRMIQQELNRRYERYIGLMPCDGVYGRNTNKALIYALQAEEGLSVPGSGVGTEANGNFGPTTQKLCPTLPDTTRKLTDLKEANFTRILDFSLYCNGFGVFDNSGAFDDDTRTALREFQQHLALPVTEVADLGTWMSLLTSKGDTSRPAEAFDCATILTPVKAQTLKNAGYKIGGRYLTGTISGGISKALTDEEIQIIFDAGLRFFPIYQTSARSEDYFTPSQGRTDAIMAIQTAYDRNIPEGTIIYFAVDFDAMDVQITNSIIPYFKSLYEFTANENKLRGYKVGVYGTRNICSRVCDRGYAVSSFVGDMSTGYSGNLGFRIPHNWAFDQFATVTIGSGDGQIEIDKDGYSGRDTGVSALQFAPLENGKGGGNCCVNRAGSNITVYRNKVFYDQSVWITADAFDVIPPNAFFVYKTTADDQDYIYRVIFTDSNGNQNEGYVDAGDPNMGGYEHYRAIWDRKEPFIYYSVNEDAAEGEDTLKLSDTITIDETVYHVFTLRASSDYFTSPDGRYAGTLPAGAKIGVKSGNATGASYPWRLYVEKKCINGVWSDLITQDGKNSGGFLNLRFDLGNEPNNRLLK